MRKFIRGERPSSAAPFPEACTFLADLRETEETLVPPLGSQRRDRAAQPNANECLRLPGRRLYISVSPQAERLAGWWRYRQPLARHLAHGGLGPQAIDRKLAETLLFRDDAMLEDAEERVGRTRHATLDLPTLAWRTVQRRRQAPSTLQFGGTSSADSL
ncbi:hypothetical protein PHYPSEUDO_005380 [Phytophthora pseudosyringae]|uniref:Uncharacterized protein n=1 Tax=Phytophthora pseudosyringae TaxID=221518 RepID=A0A8T1VPC1_9STRA|nr:hypothetical protein PHYPSEUDO_005380 [Phytophthora pseudosyringae]